MGCLCMMHNVRRNEGEKKNQRALGSGKAERAVSVAARTIRHHEGITNERNAVVVY